MKIAISGASGFVGKAVAEALANASSAQYDVVGLSRSARSQKGITEWRRCDFYSLKEAEEALKGIDVAFYLVHSMMPSARLTQGRFEDLDLIAADNFARAAKKSGVKRIIYLGGLSPTNVAKLSRHLSSRKEVEQALGAHDVPVTTLKAGLIIGPGGSSFVMLQRLVERLPAMICPKWTESLTQPIDLEAVVSLLVYCLEHAETSGKTYDIGGPTILTYRALILKVAEILGYRRYLLKFPLFTPGLSRLWVSLVTRAPRALVLPLVESLRYPMVAHDRRLQEQAKIPGKDLGDAIRAAVSAPLQKTPVTYLRPAENGNRVRSVQRLPLPPGKNALWAASEYLKWIPQASVLPLIQVRTQDEVCEFRLAFVSTPLLILRMARERSQNDRALFYILGGLLCATPGKGRFEFREVNQGKELLAAVHDFEPRLPWLIYRLTQAQLHRLVMYLFRRHLSR